MERQVPDWYRMNRTASSLQGGIVVVPVFDNIRMEHS